MDYENWGYDIEDDQDAGWLGVTRLSAKVNGHTHVYQFRDDQHHLALWAVKRDVARGKLHQYAGIMLCKMIREDWCGR